MKKKKNNTLLIVAVGILALGGASAATGYLLKQNEDLPSSQLPSSEVPSEELSEELSSETPSAEPVLAHKIELVFALPQPIGTSGRVDTTFAEFSGYSSGHGFYNYADADPFYVYASMLANNKVSNLSLDVGDETITFKYDFDPTGDEVTIMLYEGPASASDPSNAYTTSVPGRYDFSNELNIIYGSNLTPVYTPIYE